MDTLHGAFSMEVFQAALQRFIFGHIHMWFIQMLLGFYLLIPVARGLCAKKEVVQYYLLLWVVFRFLFPYLTDMLHFTTLQARIDSLGMDILIGNFGYFLLGYYLNLTEISKKLRYLLYLSGIASLGFTIFLTLKDCTLTNTYVEKWFSPAAPNILLMSTAIFTAFKYSRVFDHAKRPVMWKKLSGYTFFIYMFHVFIIEKLNLVGITTVSFPAIISIPVLTLFTFAVSLACAFIVDHIPFVRKLIMLH